MQITEVRVRMVKNPSETKLKATVSITIDNCFVVHDIKVLEGGEGDCFIAMPSKKTPKGEFRDIVHPISNETRDMLKSLILDEYKKESLRPQEFN